MRSKTQKRSIISQLGSKLAEAKTTVFASFARAGEKGLSVAEAQELKRTLRLLGGDYVVAKKRLINIASQRSAQAGQLKVGDFDGSIGVIMGGAESDGSKLIKSIHQFSNQHPAFKVLGAIWDERYLSAEDFTTLAKLPEREVLISRLLGMLQYPVSGLVGALQSNLRNLVLVLANIKKA